MELKSSLKLICAVSGFAKDKTPTTERKGMGFIGKEGTSIQMFDRKADWDWDWDWIEKFDRIVTQVAKMCNEKSSRKRSGGGAIDIAADGGEHFHALAHGVGEIYSAKVLLDSSVLYLNGKAVARGGVQ